MNAQKLILGTIAGFIALFGLGYLIYIVLSSPGAHTTDAAAAVTREFFPGIIAFEILYGMLITLIFGRWAGIKTFQTGLQAGAVIGLFLGLCMGLWLYSTTTLFETGIVWWYALTFAVRFGVAGGVIGWVLGRE